MNFLWPPEGGGPTLNMVECVKSNWPFLFGRDIFIIRGAKWHRVKTLWKPKLHFSQIPIAINVTGATFLICKVKTILKYFTPLVYACTNISKWLPQLIFMPMNVEPHPTHLKGVVSKNLQKTYICGWGGITAGVTMHTTLTVDSSCKTLS